MKQLEPNSTPAYGLTTGIVRMQRLADMIDSFGMSLMCSYPGSHLTRRLWASAGQRSLEQARVLLIGHDAAGTQTLKNLVLPGQPCHCAPITTLAYQQAFHTSRSCRPRSRRRKMSRPTSSSIRMTLDQALPSRSSSELPFGLLMSSSRQIPQGAEPIRGGSCTRSGGRTASVLYLERLTSQDPASLLQSDSEFLSAFTLVICSNVDPEVELRVANQLWERERPASDSGW